MKTSERVSRRSSLTVGTLICGLLGAAAFCLLGARDAGAANGAPLPEAHVLAAPSPTDGSVVYFGDEYAEAERALQDQPIEPMPPTF